MKFSKTLSSVFVFVCLVITSSSLCLAQRNMEIRGYLVDGLHKPLRNGKITIFYDPPLPSGGFEQLTLSWSPLPDGLFGMDVIWRSGLRLMVLMEDRPPGFYPIDNQAALTNDKIFKGVIISEFAKKKNLRKISDYVKYGRAVFDLSNCSNSFAGKILSNQMFTRILARDGTVVANTTFRPAFMKEANQLIFNLPEGVWDIEFIDDPVRKTIVPALRVTISSNETSNVDKLHGC
jgi:hypothetical protein